MVSDSIVSKIFLNRWFPCVLVAALVFLAWWPAVIHLQYVWDDNVVLHLNSGRTHWQAAWSSIWSPFIPGTRYFRPLVMVTYFWQFLLVGMRPDVSHLLNLMLHLINSMLVVILAEPFLRNFSPKQRALRAMLAGLLYGFHPALIEPVSWAMGRFDLLLTTFLLLGLFAYFQLSGFRRWVVVNLCFLLAIFCKEEALVFPLMLLLLNVPRFRAISVRAQLSTVPVHPYWDSSVGFGIGFLVIGLIWFGLRQHFVGVFLFTENPDQHAVLYSVWRRIILVGYSFDLYVGLSLWPIGVFGLVHPLPLFQGNPLFWIAGAAGVLGAIAVLTWSWRTHRAAATALLLWFIALLPVLNIIVLPIVTGYGQDRFMTFPAVFSCIAWSTLRYESWLGAQFAGHRPTISRVFRGAAFLYVVLLWLVVRTSVPLWTDDLSLWSWGIRQYPQDTTVRLNYIGACFQMQRMDLAKDYFRRFPQDDSLYVKSLKASYELTTGQVDAAVQLFTELDPTLPTSYAQLLRQVQSRPQTVLPSKVQSQHQRFTVHHYSLYTEIAQAYLLKDKYKKAYEFARIATYYSNDYWAAWMARSIAAYGMDLWQPGQQAFAQALNDAPVPQKPYLIRQRQMFLKISCRNPAQLPSVCLHQTQNATL